MKRVIYICYMNLGITGSLGIKNKISNHIRTFEYFGYKTLFIYIDNNKVISNLILNTKHEGVERNDIVYINKLICDVDIMKGDIIYIRYQHFNKSLINTVKYLHDKGAYVLFEIPTYPFIGEYKNYAISSLKKHKYKNVVGNLLNIIRYYYYSPKIGKFIDRIITYSDDNVIWNVQTIKCSNGIDVSSIAWTNDNAHKGINFICVSSCAYWHGYDRFIRGMNNYYKGDYNEEIYLHIVGDGPALFEYKQMVESKRSIK